MWRELKVPYVCERYIGFSVPRDREVWAVSFEGIHRLILASPVAVTNYTDGRYAEGGEYYDWQNSVLRFDGREMPILGMYGGAEITRSGAGETLVLLPDARVLRIVGSDGATQYEYRYLGISGDWAVATFSYDWQQAVVGLPYDLYLLERETG